MKLSVSVTNYSWADRLHDRLASLARFLDDTAVDTLWVPDHLLQADPASRTDEPMWRPTPCWGISRPRRRGSDSAPWSPLPRRSRPPLLIKAVTTLDVLSAGRGGWE